MVGRTLGATEKLRGQPQRRSIRSPNRVRHFDYRTLVDCFLENPEDHFADPELLVDATVKLYANS